MAIAALIIHRLIRPISHSPASRSLAEWLRAGPPRAADALAARPFPAGGIPGWRSMDISLRACTYRALNAASELPKPKMRLRLPPEPAHRVDTRRLALRSRDQHAKPDKPETRARLCHQTHAQPADGDKVKRRGGFGGFCMSTGGRPVLRMAVSG